MQTYQLKKDMQNAILKYARWCVKYDTTSCDKLASLRDTVLSKHEQLIKDKKLYPYIKECEEIRYARSIVQEIENYYFGASLGDKNEIMWNWINGNKNFKNLIATLKNKKNNKVWLNV